MPTVKHDERTNSVTVRIPITIRKRGGRKRVLSPDGAEISAAASASTVDNATVRAIARAFRWREMLESGQYQTIREIADNERINEAYVGRLLRLTLLAPEIVENSLYGQPINIKQLLQAPIPADWQAQGSS